ncbi:MAG: class I SAM-dependent methyltransferase [Lactobacillaceae bacterium]|jgi:ubiquinone/menaquinone biosynthesis C-methylase UbiE|nr:class I SAM-dependent methyltransferase [Lactobacillaceae bacterium]
MENYTSFAKLYDQLFDLDMYLQWKDFVVKRSNPSKLLDLGGGNGRLGIILSREKYQVTILDLSLSMLQIAQSHAEKNNVELQLINDDMTNFELNEKFNVITSFSDSINYLSSKTEIQTMFNHVFNHLNDSGVFLFDLITPHMANVTYDNYMYNNDDDPQNIFMWTTFPGEKKNSVDHDLKFFTYRKDIDAFKILREIHHEQTYENEVIMQLLKNTGFKNIQYTADFGNSKVDENSDRVFFEARK